MTHRLLRTCFHYCLILLSTQAVAQWQPFSQAFGDEYTGNSAYQIFGQRILALDTFKGPCYSLDGGKTWKKSTKGPTTNQVRSLTRQGSRAYVAYDSQLYTSADTGRTWEPIGTLLPKSLVSFAFTNQRLVALAVNYPSDIQIYTSDDQAKTWQLSSTFTQAMGTKSGGPFFHMNLATAGDTVYVGSDAGLMVSANAGQSWTVAGNEPVSWINATRNDVFIGTGTGVYTSTDLGVSWRQALKTFETLTSFRQQNLMVVSGTANRTFVSLDRGNSWKEFGKGLPTDSQAETYGFFQWKDTLRLGGNVVNGSTVGGYSNGRIVWTRAIAEAAPDYLEAPTSLFSINGFQNDAEPRDRTNLSWTDNSSQESGFVVERSVDEGQTYQSIASLPADTKTYLDKTLQTGINYYYRVRAVNSTGFSRPSNSAWVVKPVVCQTSNRLTASLRVVAFPTEAIGYTAGDDGTLLKTTDSGRTWRQLTHPAPNSKLYIIQFLTEQIGFVGGEKGVMRTLDGGQTWTLYRLPGTWGRGIGQMHFINANRGFVSENTDSYGTLYLTTDGGLTWTVVNGAQNGRSHELINSLTFTDSLTGYIAGNNGVLLKTSDGGTVWQNLISSTKPETNSFSKLVFIDSRRGYVMAGTQLRRTEDGGLTWQQVMLPAGVTVRDMRFTDAAHGLLLTAYDYNRKTPFFKTDNAGNTWEAVPQSFTSVQSIPDLLSLGVRGATLWAVGNYNGLTRGLFVSRDSGTNWQALTGDIGTGPALSLAFRTQQEGILLRKPVFDTPPTTYYFTIDGGEIWQQRSLPGTSGGLLAAVHFFDAQRGVIVGQSALWRTADGGQTWQRYNTSRGFNWWTGNGGSTPVSYQYIKFISFTEWTACDAAFNYYRTIDGGLTWNRVTTIPTVGNNGFDFTDVSFGSALNGVRRDLSYTTDGGKTWKKGRCRTTDAAFIASVRMTGSTVAYAYETNYSRMLKTTDGGANWYPTAYEWWKIAFGGHVLTYSDPETVYASSDNGNQLVRLSPGNAPGIETYRTSPKIQCLSDSGVYQTQADPSRLYHWSIPDGQGTLRGDREKITVTWTTPGKHVLRLIVEDGCGMSAPSDQLVNVLPGPPKPVITLQDSLLVSSYTGPNAWYFNGNNLYVDQQTLSLRRSTKWQPGIYAVEAVDTLGCRTRSEPFKYVITALQLPLMLADQIRVYPNPAQDIVHVQIGSTRSVEAVVDILTIQGALVQTHKVSQSIQIPVRSLPMGLYLLRIRTTQGEATYRLLVQP